MTSIIPAILSNDLADFKEKLAVLEPWAPGVHIDIADGRFVANTTLTYEALAPVLKESLLPIELHLMVADPWPIAQLAHAAGLARLLVQAETITSPTEYLTHLAAGWPLGLVFNLQTPWGDWEKDLANLPEIMLMGVEPGWQGQTFDPRVLERLHFLQDLRKSSFTRGVSSAKTLPECFRICRVALDGGVNAQTIQKIVAAGADQVVVGSALWNTPDPQKTYQELCVLASQKPKNLKT